MLIDGLQYCNWSEKIFREWRSSNVDAVHVTISYHEQFRETVSNFEKWNNWFEKLPVPKVNKKCWDRLKLMAFETYVPESETSKSGAGY